MKRHVTIRTKSALLALATLFIVGVTVGMPCQAAGDSKSFEYPEGRMGDVAAIFLHAFDSDGDAAIADFHKTYLSEAALKAHPLDQQLWRYNSMAGMLGTLTPQKVVEKKASSLVLLVKSEEIGTYFHLGLEFNDAKPKMLDDFFIRPAAKPK